MPLQPPRWWQTGMSAPPFSFFAVLSHFPCSSVSCCNASHKTDCGDVLFIERCHASRLYWPRACVVVPMAFLCARSGTPNHLTDFATGRFLSCQTHMRNHM